ncbi:hypothetical protein HF086_009558 [Spodoptera exigua]|uniref:Uncharacterized protein n=1 Tax=Spodoptera exigua TaxID=7107 RepID=A0A922SAR5_SPOEX|nr:hypothetical protein HF086_009558 [Spodoptera exigua]
MTPDQLSVLHDTDSVDWKCKTCAGSSKPKRLSCIMPEMDGDGNTDTEPPITHTHTVYADNEYEAKIHKYEKSMKDLENRCTDLQNHAKNTKVKYEVLETKINQIEQAQLSNQLEICGINQSEKENPEEIAKKVAIAITQNPDDVIKAYRKRRNPSNMVKKKDQPAITVMLRDGIRDQWIDAAKSSMISAASMGQDGAEKIYLRECLTPSTAYLLWKTKEELKGLFSYIWCKHGNILVRKSEQEKKNNHNSRF